MNRPRIGITIDRTNDRPSYSLGFAYVQAVEKAGGLPMPLPYRVDHSLIAEYLDQLDGILLTGGNDLNPDLYGETYHPQAQPIDPDRQSFEFAILDHIARQPMPVLGICLGMQVMNVHRGGSMIQFLPDHLGADGFDHRFRDDHSRRHGATLIEDCRYARELGKSDLAVNTHHKQACKTMGRGLRIIAKSFDGVIEGLDDPTLPFYMGVQWHPERQHEEADHLKLFQMLVAAANCHRK